MYLKHVRPSTREGGKKLEDKSIEFIQTERELENKVLRNEQSLSDLRASIKLSNTDILGASEGEERVNKAD